MSGHVNASDRTCVTSLVYIRFIRNNYSKVSVIFKQKKKRVSIQTMIYNYVNWIVWHKQYMK